MNSRSFIGYARVSTPEQKLDMQTDALKKSGCHRIFTDVASGAKNARPGLAQAMDFLREGDTLVVWKLDRLGRSLSHLVQTVEALAQRGVAFKSISEGNLDSHTPAGKMMLGMFGVLAEFERELIRERTKTGLAVAKARGRSGGRKPVITEQKLQKARLYLAQGMSVRDAAYSLKVGKSSLYKAISEQKGAT